MKTLIKTCRINIKSIANCEYMSGMFGTNLVLCKYDPNCPDQQLMKIVKHEEKNKTNQETDKNPI